ncbi:SIS domain-containing protein [Aulographum hederae CBS 113979]|uniref:SIS domain-containing protein n=1 Tax=Aulographum hederae CBS 113979 TaxID=1176131 RepID=A0A6G1GVY0_9PEZI|nr:SIS domain-containing protein [Aulographum hederae CBS 113979]
MAITSLPSPIPEATQDATMEQPRSLKRKRSMPLTPPITLGDAASTKQLESAVHVLSTQATALSHITRLYQTVPVAQNGFLAAVETIVRINEAGGKLVVCGVGKSGLVGQKTVATMKSLGLATAFMHAAEAMHGDLGDVRKNDAVLFISFSGRTAELLKVMEYIDHSIPVMALTAHTEVKICPLFANRPEGILLPAPIHEPEEVSFGVCAPTTSTTVAIAIGDMLALTAAERLHEYERDAVFRKNHPGGAIGASKKRG